MFKSILQDLKSNYRFGHTVTKLLYVMVIASLVMILIKAIVPHSVEGLSFYDRIVDILALPSTFKGLLFRPWTLITYMFINTSFWSLLFAGLLLHMFGRITGDLMGDHRILPLFIMSGILSGITFIIFNSFIASPSVYLMESLPSILCIAVVGAMVAPDYSVRLLLLGDVKIKFIVGILILLMILGVFNQGAQSTYIARISGIAFALLFVYNLRNGLDLTEKFWSFKNLFTPKNETRNMTVVHKQKANKKSQKKFSDDTTQERIDQILDKISQKGYDSLSEEEKEYLFLASKK